MAKRGGGVREPWATIEWADRLTEVGSLQGLMRGDAPADAQRKALDFIIHEIAATYDLSFTPGDTHATAFAEGRRWVGLQIVRLLKVNLMRAEGRKRNASATEQGA